MGVHKALIKHEIAHGGNVPLLWPYAHWMKIWLIQKCRQWADFDIAISGSNPLLGSLLAASYVQQGLKVIWFKSNKFDAWDYPLCMNGSNDDLFISQGLPRMGCELFDKLALICSGKLLLLNDSEIKYFEDFNKGFLTFINTDCDSSSTGEARKKMESLFIKSFNQVEHFHLKKKPKRFGNGNRELFIGTKKLALISEILDGTERVHSVHFKKKEAQESPQIFRLGRAKWYTQVPLDFASLSRDDIREALSLYKVSGEQDVKKN